MLGLAFAILNVRLILSLYPEEKASDEISIESEIVANWIVYSHGRLSLQVFLSVSRRVEVPALYGVSIMTLFLGGINRLMDHDGQVSLLLDCVTCAWQPLWQSSCPHILRELN